MQVKEQKTSRGSWKKVARNEVRLCANVAIHWQNLFKREARHYTK